MLRLWEGIALGAAVVFAAAIVVLMVGYSSQRPQEKPNKEVTEQYEAKYQEGEQSESLWQRTLRDPVAFFTFWLMIFTAVLGATAVFQLKALGRAEQISSDAAKAAKDAAVATRDAVTLARETSQRQLRAYVSVTGATITNFGSEQPVQAAVDIQNTGQTPAYKMTGKTLITTREFPISNPLPDMQVDNAAMDLGPGAVFTLRIGTARPLTAQENATVRAGTLAIYVYGVIRYEDAFGVHHETAFRLCFRGDVGETGQMHPYESGNNSN